ncbi:WD repeat protein [Grosmannia clavigera kw1407]|uniref:WD repeat protein n=1 Tax=Grosmannia clavigera (strain kw1407 / UAMH 11150) TaxID=655863 RepID=F0X9Y8_GROCL|nr:WD repeat protein [Grosmannia clavigera kw1407]EFX05704.1 WD repeat protein [Grosmannia clavigera kw1407]
MTDDAAKQLARPRARSSASPYKDRCKLGHSARGREETTPPLPGASWSHTTWLGDQPPLSSRHHHDQRVVCARPAAQSRFLFVSAAADAVAGASRKVASRRALRIWASAWQKTRQQNSKSKGTRRQPLSHSTRPIERISLARPLSSCDSRCHPLLPSGRSPPTARDDEHVRPQHPPARRVEKHAAGSGRHPTPSRLTTLSDGFSSGYDPANSQPGTSNYMTPWAMYAFDWCRWPSSGNGAGKLAIGSYLEDGHNFIQILDTHITQTPMDAFSPGTSKFSMEFTKVAEATHTYPVTRLLWEPPSPQKQSTDLLATSGDHLRLWSLPSDTPSGGTSSSTIGRGRADAPPTKLTPLALLSNSKTPDHTAPLTSLDWNTVSPSLIITSSIDTTCTIWDIPSLTAKTQLIAHDKEVYDVRFCANSMDVFVSCGQDGSVRMFDLRSLEHSTIIYEPTGKDERDAQGGRISPTLAQQTMSHPPPLLRLATSPHDTHLLATFAQDSDVIRILDVRQPGQALLELRGHGGAVNCVEWSPHRRGMLASGADDCQVLIWDLLNSGNTAAAPVPPGVPANGGPQPDNARAPVAAWQCDYEVGNLGWVPRLSNSDYGEWLGVSGGRGIWGVRF